MHRESGVYKVRRRAQRELSRWAVGWGRARCGWRGWREQRNCRCCVEFNWHSSSRSSTGIPPAVPLAVPLAVQAAARRAASAESRGLPGRGGWVRWQLRRSKGGEGAERTPCAGPAPHATGWQSHQACPRPASEQAEAFSWRNMRSIAPPQQLVQLVLCNGDTGGGMAGAAHHRDLRNPHRYDVHPMRRPIQYPRLVHQSVLDFQVPDLQVAKGRL